MMAAEVPVAAGPRPVMMPVADRLHISDLLDWEWSHFSAGADRHH